MKKDVITFGPHDSLFDVAETMAKNNITGAPVVDGRDIVGIITISDIMKFMRVKLPHSDFLTQEPHSMSMMVAGMVKQNIEFRHEMKKISRSMVKDFMSQDIISTSPEATLIEVAEILEKNKVDRLLVINDKKILVGIISRTDLLRALLD